MEIINAHSHVYPEKIAFKATNAIGEFYHTGMFGQGTTDDLIADGKKAGIDRYLVCSCATTVKQVHSINEFLLNEKSTHDKVDALITLHQDMTEEEAFNEVEWGVANGFKGIKLHPDFQKFSVNDEAVFGIYRAAQGKFPILFHAGDYRYKYSNPALLAEVAKKFPKLNMICAHFGGYSEWDDLAVYDGLENVFFDTSSALFCLEPKVAVEWIRRFGADKYCFGTDYPMWNAVDEMRRFGNLKLTDEEREKILSLNAKRIFDLQ